MSEREGHSGSEPPPGRARALSAAEADLLVRQLDALPSSRAFSVGILHLAARCAQSGQPNAELLDAMSIDLATACKMLALAGGARTVAEAANRIGPQATLAAALAVSPEESHLASPAGLDMAGLSLHSLAVACAAKMLAQASPLAMDADEAFTCGLLHDVGKLALHSCMPKSYARILAAAGGETADLPTREREFLGIDHAVFGRRLTQHWRLGETIQEVVWLHHQPASSLPHRLTVRPMIVLVALADAIAHQAGLDCPPAGSNGGARHARQAIELLSAELHLPAGSVADIAKQLPEIVRLRRGAVMNESQVADSSVRDAMLLANQALSKLCLSASRCGDAQADEIFARFSQLTRTIGPDAGIPDVLAGLADVLTSGHGGVVAAYSIDAEDRVVLAARGDGGKPDVWRTLAMIEGFDPYAVAPANPREAMSALLADPVELADWLDLSACTHEPMLCVGRWIGGVILPPGQDAQKFVGAISGAMGLTLGFAQGRQRSVRLGEDLAAASQVLRQTHEALADAHTLSMLGQMAAGAAHEMNTPLAVISGRAQLQRDHAADEAQRKTWQTIADQAQRISDIVSAMMELASPREPKPEAVGAGELLHRAAEAFFYSTHPTSLNTAADANKPPQPAAEAFSNSARPQASHATVDIEVEARTPEAWCDRDQVQAILLELMANASTAAGGQPRVHLSASRDDADGTVVLAVRDEGSGMDSETAASAFTPFFSRQAAGRKLGLGLARVRRYAELNGGRVWLQTQPGAGTTVRVKLPSARQ